MVRAPASSGPTCIWRAPSTKRARSRSNARCARCSPSSDRAEGIAMKTEPNLKSPDDFYERLMEAHRGLDMEQSAQLNARPILLMANQIGDDQVLQDCIAAAAKTVR